MVGYGGMDWVTISALATAGGALALAAATYGSVRSANRAARVAERTLMGATVARHWNVDRPDPR